jgi:hypothetical protein
MSGHEKRHAHTHVNGVDDIPLATTLQKGLMSPEQVIKLSGLTNNDIIASVNEEIGAVVLDADDISDLTTIHRFLTTTQFQKLSGIEDGATGDQTGAEIVQLINAELNGDVWQLGAAITSVNSKTGDVVLNADDISDLTTVHKFMTAAQISKLGNIETGATDDQTGSEIVALINQHLNQTDWKIFGGIDTINSQIGDAVLNADHISDASTAHKFVTVEQISKLASIEDNAKTDQTPGELISAINTELGGQGWQVGPSMVDSVNGQTGDVVLNADDISDLTTVHKFLTDEQLNKLSTIEDNATGDQTGAEIVSSINSLLGTGWQTGSSLIWFVISSSTTVVNKGAYIIANPSEVRPSGEIILTVPSNPSVGDRFSVFVSNTYDTVKIGSNLYAWNPYAQGVPVDTIEGVVDHYPVSPGFSQLFIYVNATEGWRGLNRTMLRIPSLINNKSMTGDTVVNSGKNIKLIKRDRAMVHAWANIANLVSGRYGSAACGTRTAGLNFAGSNSSAVSLNTCEYYNGSVWSTVSNLMPYAVNRLAGCGTFTAAIGFGGINVSTINRYTQQFNGYSWYSSAGHELGTPRWALAGCGTNTATLSFGGHIDQILTNPSAKTEGFNGYTWSTKADLGTPRANLGGVGTQTDAISFGGFDNTQSTRVVTERYNGSTWSNSGSLLTARAFLGGCGQTTAALSFGGNTASGPSVVANTEEYDGLTWVTGGNLITARNYLSGCGSQSGGLSIGGNSAVKNTELYTISEVVTDSVYTISKTLDS